MIAAQGMTMKTLLFENSAASIRAEDINFIEVFLKNKLPESFRNLYLTHNGGNPTNTIFPATVDWDALEVVGFYPIKYKTPAFDTDNSLLLEHYYWLLQKMLSHRSYSHSRMIQEEIFSA